MSVSTRTRVRLPKIKKGLVLGQTLEEIARECGVTERTIYRDKEAWLASGDFETWLRDEWLRYHLLVGKTDPTEAYRQLTKLVGRQIAQRIHAEIKEEQKIEITWKEPSDSSGDSV